MSRLVRLAAIVAIVAGCGSAPPAATPAPVVDPYELVHKAAATTWDPIQIELGLSAKQAGTTVTIDPSSVRLVIDSKAGKGLFHLSIPAAALGADAASLAGLGLNGGNIDLDVLFDGSALYAKSPLAASLLPILLAQSGGGLPSGDLTGWLQIGTKEELGAIASGAAAPSPSAGAADLSSLDPAALKTRLASSGVTLSYAGAETHGAGLADHLTLGFDLSKALADPAIGSVGGGQLQQLRSVATGMTVSGDLWIDRASSRLSEFDLHGAASAGSTSASLTSFDVRVLVGNPDPGTSFAAPASAVEVPLSSLMGSLMQLAGQGANGPTIPLGSANP